MYFPDLLKHPQFYNLKSTLLSCGRRSVRAYLRQTIAVPPDARVLEVGCGAGRHAGTFSARYVGVDLSWAYLSYAAAHRPGRFARMDATCLGFPDGKFEFVFCVGLCHHLPDAAVAAAMAEMKRVIRPGGNVCVVDAVVPASPNVPGRVLCALDRGEHLRPLERLAALLRAQGLRLHCANIPGSFPYQRAVFLGAWGWRVEKHPGPRAALTA
ncbi:MAG: class I SAM-dependent methyltransferase [Candidatus Hydrogenedentes bacterium]|nr:class I SAM-dependent methyltransferase [Candidatus Hydrogenedentota bacterium]